jgi:thiamine-monophosphate kinase
MREFDLIARYFAPLAGPGGLGLVDDAAMIKPPAGHDLVITCDAIAAGTHFFADDPPAAIGHKLLAVNLSDLAAKGAEPMGFMLSLHLSRKAMPDDAWMAAFVDGLDTLAKESGIQLLGGDTVMQDGPLNLSITAFGLVPTGRMLKRSGAQFGDLIVVTGFIGDGALGLRERIGQRSGIAQSLTADHSDYLIDRYLRPQPRFKVAHAFRRYAHACMDISDGLIGDCAKLLAVSGKGGILRLVDVPKSVAVRAALRDNPKLIEQVVTGGDDYELLAAVSPANWERLQEACLQHGVMPVVIGTVTEASAGFCVLDEAGKDIRFAKGSYTHEGQQ